MNRMKLGEILSVKHGWAFKGEYFAEDGERSILTPGNFFEKGGFKPNNGKERYYTGVYPKEYLCHKGDLIVAMTQQAEGLLGSTALVPENDKYLHNQRIGLITCDEKRLNKLFAYYLFMTKSVREQLERSSSGTKVKHTSPEKIYDVEVEIPDVISQQKIANLLWSVDEKIANNKAINDNLEQQAQSYFQELFVDNADPEWTTGTISDLGTVVGGSTPSKAKPEYYTESGIAWITPKDLSNNKSKFVSHGENDITELGLRNSSASIMPEGTVLFSSRAPIGYIAIAAGEVTTNQGFKSVVPKPEIGTPFVYFFLKNTLPVIEGMASGSTFKEVSGSTMKNVPAVIPDAETLAKFSDFCAPIFAQQRILEEQNQSLATLRDNLLPKLMSGEIDVSAVQL